MWAQRANEHIDASALAFPDRRAAVVRTRWRVSESQDCSRNFASLRRRAGNEAAGKPNGSSMFRAAQIARICPITSSLARRSSSSASFSADKFPLAWILCSAAAARAALFPPLLLAPACPALPPRPDAAVDEGLGLALAEGFPPCRRALASAASAIARRTSLGSSTSSPPSVWPLPWNLLLLVRGSQHTKHRRVARRASPCTC